MTFENSSLKTAEERRLEISALFEEQARRRAHMNASDSLSDFFRAAFETIEPNQRFVPGYHIDAICDHLEAVKRGEIRNLLINIPPRHVKSTIVSVTFDAYVWKDEPWTKFIHASHAYSLSKRDSLKTRNLINSHWYQRTFDIKWELASDQNEKMRFDNTEKGSRIATSIGGAVIGEGGDYLIIDDPHSPREVYSDVTRQSVLDWYDMEFSTRVNDPKTVKKIIIMQRLHQQDLSQHVLDKGNWEHLCLPLEYEGSKKVTSIGWSDPRKDMGEILWPNRFGPKEVENFKVDLTPRGVAGQLQQRPAPMEGNIVKREWWKFYTVLPADLDLQGISADLTFKDGKKNDFVVFQVWGRRKAEKFLMDQVRARMSFTASITALKALCAKWPKVGAKWIEDAANAAAMLDLLRKEIHGLILVRPNGSKLARAEAVTPQIQAGNIWLPDPSIASWVNDYIEEWAVFPNGMNDDQVDASSLGISQLTSRAPTVLPINITAPSKWLR